MTPMLTFELASAPATSSGLSTVNPSAAAPALARNLRRVMSGLPPVEVGRVCERAADGLVEFMAPDDDEKGAVSIQTDVLESPGERSSTWGRARNLFPLSR